MFQKFKVFISLAVFFISLVVAFCTYANTYSKGNDEFTIAAIYPATGHYANLMCITDEVVKQAQKRGQHVRLIRLDNQNNVIGSVLAAKRAVQHKVDAVVGPITSEQAKAASKVLNQAKIPFFFPIAVSPSTSKDLVYMIKMTPDTKNYIYFYVKLMAEQLRKSKTKRLVIISNISLLYSCHFSSEVTKELTKILPGVKINSLKITDNYRQFPELVNKILKLKPDVLFIPLYTKQVSNLFVEMSKYTSKDLSFKMFTTSGQISLIINSSYYNLISKALPNVTTYTISEWWGKAQGPFAKNYESLMRKSCKFSRNEFGSAIAYDTIALLLNLAKKYPHLRGLALINAAKTSKFNGVVGEIKYNKKSGINRPLFLYILKNGRVAFKKLKLNEQS